MAENLNDICNNFSFNNIHPQPVKETVKNALVSMHDMEKEINKLKQENDIYRKASVKYLKQKLYLEKKIKKFNNSVKDYYIYLNKNYTDSDDSDDSESNSE